MGIVLVSYVIDNPFGERGDPGWRLYLRNLPLYALHVVQRDRSIAAYRERGAREVFKIQTAYEPTLHFPPPVNWSDRDRSRPVSFIGTPYDDRAAVLARLWRDEGLDVRIDGSSRAWRRALDSKSFAALWQSNGRYGDAYREAIWRSKINLSFVTHANQDEFAHKSFEIAGCGGFLLAERSVGHTQRFVEDEEAVFFSGFEELSAKIRRYLPDEAARARIAAAGHARAARDGYDNDRQVGLVIARAKPMVEALQDGRAVTSLAR
jgi:spore maturation protein CgeB